MKDYLGIIIIYVTIILTVLFMWFLTTRFEVETVSADAKLTTHWAEVKAKYTEE